MLSTGSTLNFGIATVVGVFAGSLVTALATGRFHLEGYQSPRHMLRSAGGAALMGAGGVMAFGCSIGQGLTGLSTLALASFIAVAGILLGTAAGLRGALQVRPLAAPERHTAFVTIRISECQRAVHRALVGDLHQLLALLGIERALDRNLALDLVEHALARLALLAVLCVDLAVLQRHRDAIERQRFSVGIHPHGHGGAGAETRQQEIVGPGAGVLAAGGDRLVGDQLMRADRDGLLELAGAGFLHDDPPRRLAGIGAASAGAGST